MSASGLKAAFVPAHRHVGEVPTADSCTAAKCSARVRRCVETYRPFGLVVESEIDAANVAGICEPLKARRVCRVVYSSTLAATLLREHQAHLDRLFQFDAEASPPL